VSAYLTFLFRVWRLSFLGSRKFYAWMTLLTVLCLLGLHAWARQFVDGLQTTGMTNQVSWGAYIANFTFLVGVALDVLTADGAHVYWLEGAHIRREIRPQNHPDRIDGLNGLVRAATVDLDHVTTVPYRDFIGANGTARERHTRDDGVHLSLGGMAEVSDWLVDDVFVESAPSVRESG